MTDPATALKALASAYAYLTSNPGAWQALMDDLEAKAASIPDPDHRAGATLLLLHLLRRSHLTRSLKANGAGSTKSKTTIGAT